MRIIVPLGTLIFACLPLTSVAQRIELALLGGWYQAAPKVLDGRTGIECVTEPCPYYYREARTTSMMLGGRVTIELGRRFGLDATWQRAARIARVTWSQTPGGAPIDTTSYERSLTFLALQPHIRFRWSEQVEAVASLGPAFAVHAPPLDVVGRRDIGVGLALSASLRARLTTLMSLEVRASDFRRLAPGDTRNHLIAGAGLAFALNP